MYRTKFVALVLMMGLLLMLIVSISPAEEQLIKAVWYLSLNGEEYLDSVDDMGVIRGALCPTHILIVAIVYQDNKTSSNPHIDTERTVTDETLQQLIWEIRRLGLEVILLPVLFVDDGTWEGAIAPEDLGLWFDHWQGILLHYAALVEETDVDVFLLGSELVTLRNQKDEWEELIAAVRNRYSGKLSYSANWWYNHQYYLEVFEFPWDKLDYIGLTAYFELTDNNDTSIEELKAAWYNDSHSQNVVADLEALNREYDKPVVFFEAGYQSKDETTIEPWNYLHQGEVDEGEQADAWTALLNVFTDIEWFSGYAIYAEQVGLLKDPWGYGVLGKKAEEVLGMCDNDI